MKISINKVINQKDTERESCRYPNSCKNIEIFFITFLNLNLKLNKAFYSQNESATFETTTLSFEVS
jgi:hypothetical protein